MNKIKKAELIQRSLGLRHKIKVLESMETPDTHEEITNSTISCWEFEDELRAIEELLQDERRKNIENKKDILIKGGVDAIKRLRERRQTPLPKPGLKTQKKTGMAKKKKAASKK